MSTRLRFCCLYHASARSEVSAGETLLDAAIKALRLQGVAVLNASAHDHEAGAWLDLERRASDRLRRAVVVAHRDGALVAKVRDWPASAAELAVTMKQIRHDIVGLGARGHRPQ